MSQIVTKQSLNVLANLAFPSLLCKDDPNLKPEHNLEGGVGAAVYSLLKKEQVCPGDQDDFINGFENGFGEGAEFGLSVAAAIVTHGLDSGNRRFKPASRKPSAGRQDAVWQHGGGYTGSNANGGLIFSYTL